MSTRRDIRKAIQRGTSVPATVEEYKLGWATVRLAPNGARLTNLSTQGAIVKEGDRVIVDYSAGVKPVVRPLFIPEYEEEELPIAPGHEVEGEDDDWSCMVGVYYGEGWGIDPYGNRTPQSYCWHQYVPMSTWTRMHFGDNWWYASWALGGVYGDTAELFDTAEGPAGMYNERDNWGQDYLTVTRSGKYYIHGQCEFDDVDGNRATGVGYYDGSGDWYVWDGDLPNGSIGTPKLPDNTEQTPYNNDGHFALRITKNDIPLAMVNGRSTENGDWTQGGLDGPYMTIQTIAWLEEGDIIALELWENNNGPYMNPGWGFPMSGTWMGNHLGAVLIPGTERAINVSFSSQPVYMDVINDRAIAYTVGAYEGGNDYRKPGYLAGGKVAGYLDSQQEWDGYPTPDAYKSAYTYGDDGTVGASDAQPAYLYGNPHV